MRKIRAMAVGDWPEVEEIYRQGIATRDATFETEPPSWEEFDAGRLSAHRLVCVEDGRIVGWAALSPTSRRECYAGVVEHSVYVRDTARGSGIGRMLLEALVESAEAAGLWTLQTSIFPENEASLASTSGSASASWDAGSGSHGSTAAGGTRSSWSVALPGSSRSDRAYAASSQRLKTTQAL